MNDHRRSRLRQLATGVALVSAAVSAPALAADPPTDPKPDVHVNSPPQPKKPPRTNSPRLPEAPVLNSPNDVGPAADAGVPLKKP